MCSFYLHLPLEDALPLLNRVQVWRNTWPIHHFLLQQEGSSHLGGVFGVVMLENSFWREGIICFRMSQYMLESMFPLNESQLLSTSSSHAAPDYDATTTMLDCRQGTTCWTSIYLRLNRPQDMIPVIHALGQVAFIKLFAGFLWASFRRGFFLGWWLCKQTCCSVCRMVWVLTSWHSTSATAKAMLAALMRLFFEASFCIWCTAQGLNIFDQPLRGLVPCRLSANQTTRPYFSHRNINNGSFRDPRWRGKWRAGPPTLKLCYRRLLMTSTGTCSGRVQLTSANSRM